MELSLTGRSIAALPPPSGVSKRSGQPGMSQNFVLQTDERFPQVLVFKVFGMDRIQQWNIQIGETLTVFFSVDGHESNGKWYGENTAYNVVRAGQQMQPQYQVQTQYQQPVQQPPMAQPAPQPFPPQVNTQGQPVQAPFPPQQPAPQQAQGQQLPFPPAQ